MHISVELAVDIAHMYIYIYMHNNKLNIYIYIHILISTYTAALNFLQHKCLPSA